MSTFSVGKIMIYSIQHVTSEFCDERILRRVTSEYCNGGQENFTTSNQWILKGVNFAMSNTQENECCNGSCCEWASLQTAENHWEVMLSKIEVLWYRIA